MASPHPPGEGKGEGNSMREVGTITILSLLTAGYMAIWLLLQPHAESVGITFPSNKSFTLAWFGFILAWSWMFLKAMVKGELFEIETDLGRVGLLIGLGYILVTAWIYG